MLTESMQRGSLAALLYFPATIAAFAATDCQEFSDGEHPPVFWAADDPEPLLFTPLSAALELAVRGFDERYRTLFQDCGLDLVDTAKPNALAIFPASDHNGAFSSIHLGWFVRGLQEHYDLQPFVAAQEQEVYAILDHYALETDLLIFLGHGTQRSISLGEEDCRLFECNRSETYTLDLSDEEELFPYLTRLNSDAVIFLESCSTGYGEAGAENFANMVMRNAVGRVVYAGTAPFQASGIRVNHWYPFDVTIMGTWGMPTGFFGFMPITDVTYTNQGHEE
ncbi:MAG: hypothetical protein Q8R53_00430 [Nanoarchaeota archaeon]|nr:hypothetical protein [Nanoarchaeota archaeon]